MRVETGHIIIMTLLLFVSTMMPATITLGQGGIRTVVSVSIDPPHYDVDTSPSGDSKAYFNATVDVQAFPGAQTVLDVSADTGEWTNEIDQSVKTVTGSGSAVFLITVTAPFGTPGGTVQEVNVTVDWRTTSIPPDSGQVTATAPMEVETFYAVNLYIPTTWRSAKQGESIDLELKVYNKGNANDIINTWIDNDRELKGQGWVLKIDDISSDLPPNNSSRTMIHITVPTDATPDQKVIIIIKAKSEAGEEVGEKAEDTANITINVKASGGNGGNGNNGSGDNNGTDTNTTKKKEPICNISSIFIAMPMALIGVVHVIRSRRGTPPWL